MPVSEQLQVDILAAPETASSILYGLYDVMSLPGSAWPRVVRTDPGSPLVNPRIVARDGNPFSCRGGVPVAPQATLDEADDATVICVPNMTIPIEGDPRGKFPDEVAWLRARYEAGATIATTCSGSILLAEAGLLEDADATAHWAYRDMYRRYYPRTRFRPERTLCFAGEGDRLILTGGMASWQDLALYLIGRFVGPEHAAQAARFYIIGDRTHGQLPFAALPKRPLHDDETIQACQFWVADSYADSDAVAKMQSMSGLPARTFGRRFKAATGFTPLEYVQAVRIEEAKQMLETGAASIDAVAAEAGYQDARAFRRLFRRRTGVSPADYRRRFRYARMHGREGDS
ncbi:MAG: helix-turn-helix domain-containing protein [Alphaproteobacteria bacterium]